jgi:hypothetical protein
VDESLVIASKSEEATEVLDICWLGPKSNGLNLIRVNRNSYLTNDVSQVGQLVLCEGAVAMPDLPLILSQELKNNVQVANNVIIGASIKQYVIQKYKNTLCEEMVVM